jgi:filamentous hemagglutinin family protein
MKQNRVAEFDQTTLWLLPWRWGRRRSGAIIFNAVLSLHLVWLPVLQARAQSVIVDPTAPIQFRPNIGVAGNNVPLVNIVTPRPDGVSHNRFEKYDVPQQGLILNNSNFAGTSQLGGLVAANPNVAAARASVILNEVRGTLRSILEGPTEIFGGKADLIVANPNGITCSGCGFINTARATLTTGVPDFGANGLELTVRQGDVLLDGGKVSGADALALLARTVKIATQVAAGQEISVVAGQFSQTYADKAITKLTPDGSTAPVLAIDATNVGALEAGRISIVGTEAGVGVKLDGYMAATAQDLVIDASGKLTLRGGEAERDAIVKAPIVDLQNDLWAKRTIAITTPDLTLRQQASLRGANAAVEDIILAVDNHLVLEANADKSKQAEIFGQNVTITGNATADINGWIYALTNADLSASQWNIASDSGLMTVGAGSALVVDGNIVNSGTIASENAAWLKGSAAQGLINRGTVRAQGVLLIDSGTFTNEAAGAFLSRQDMGVTLSGNLQNSGTMGAETGLAVFAINGQWNNVGTARFYQAAGSIGSLLNQAAGQWVVDDDMRVTIAGNAENSGLISLNRQSANNGLFVTGNYTQNATGAGLQGNNVRLAVNGTLNIASGATVKAEQSLDLKSANFLNPEGTLIVSNGTIRIEGVGGLTNRGDIKSGTDMMLIASGAGADINNYKLLASAATLSMDAADRIYNGENARIWSWTDMSLNAGGQIENFRAEIEARGNMTIRAASLKNHRGPKETVVCNQGGRTRNCTTERMAGDPDPLTADPQTPTAKLISHGDMAIILTGLLSNETALISADGDMTLKAGSVENIAHTFKRKYEEQYEEAYEDCFSSAFGGVFCSTKYRWVWGVWRNNLDDGFVNSYIYVGKGLTATIGGGSATDGSSNGLFSNQSGVLEAHTLDIAAQSFQNGHFDTGVNIADPTQPNYAIDLSDLARIRTNRITRETSSAYNTGAGLFTVDPANSRYKISISMPVTPALDQSYFLDKLGITGSQPRFFSDPIYEQELLREAALQQTGRTYFQKDWRTAQEQQQGLYDNLIAFAKANPGIQLGQALSEAQIAKLDQPLLWYVDKMVDGETVRVPTVYLPKLARENLTQYAQGRIIAEDASIKVVGTFEDKAGRIEIGNNFALDAEDILFTAHQNKDITLGRGTELRTTTNITSGLSVGGNLYLKARDDMLFQGAKVNVAGGAALDAGGDIVIASVTDTVETTTRTLETSGMLGSTKTETISKTFKGTNQAAVFNIGEDLSLTAQNDINIIGSNLNVAGRGEIHSEAGNINIQNAWEQDYSSTQSTKRGVISTTIHEYGHDNTTAAASSLNFGGDLRMTAAGEEGAGNVTLTGSNIKTGGDLRFGEFTIARNADGSYQTDKNGNFVTVAGGSVNNLVVAEAMEQYKSWDKTTTYSMNPLTALTVLATGSGFSGLMLLGGYVFSSSKFVEKKEDSSEENHQHAVGSTLDVGGNLILGARNDMLFHGTKVNVGGNAVLDAGGDIVIASVTDTVETTTRTLEPSGILDSTKTETISKTFKGTNQAAVFNIVGNLSLTAQNDINIIGSDLNVSGGGAIHSESGNINIQNAWEQDYASTQSVKQGVISTTIHQYGHDNTTAAASNLNFGGDLRMTAAGEEGAGNVTLTGSNIKTGGDLRFGEFTIARNADGSYQTDKNGNFVTVAGGSVNNLVVAEAMEQYKSWDKTTTYSMNPLMAFVAFAIGGPMLLEAYRQDVVSGGKFADKKEDSLEENHQHAASSTVDVGGNLIAKIRGDMNVSGSDVSAQGSGLLDVDGSMTVAAATENHRTAESHSQIGFSGVDAKFEQGRGSVGANFKQEKDTTVTTDQTHRQSNLSFGGSVLVNARDDITLLGSNLIAEDDVIARAGQDISIEAAAKNYSQTNEHEDNNLRISAGVGNAYVDAGYAVNNLVKAVEAVKKAKDALSEAEKQHAEGKLTDEGLQFARLNLAGALANLYQANLAAAKAGAEAAVAAGTSAGTGFYGDVKLDISGTKSKSTTDRVTYTASYLGSRSGNVDLSAGNNLNILGSDLDAAMGSINLAAVKNVAIEASADTEITTQSSKDYHTSVTLFSSKGAIGSGEAGYGQSDTFFGSTTYRNSQITAANSLNITSGGDTKIRGAVLDGLDTTLNIGGDLTVASLQDTATSRSSSMGVSVGWGDSFSAGGNFGKGTGDKAWVSEQTEILGRGSVNVNVAGAANVTGAKIANELLDGTDGGHLQFNVASLTWKDLQDKDERTDYGFGANIGFSKQGSSSISANYSGYDKRQTTRATLGQGDITINEDGGAPDELNRDLALSQEITRDVSKGNLNLNVTIDNRMFSKEGRQSIADNFTDTAKFAKDIGSAIKTVAGSDKLNAIDVFGAINKEAAATQIGNKLVRAQRAMDEAYNEMENALASGDQEKIKNANDNLNEVAKNNAYYAQVLAGLQSKENSDQYLAANQQLAMIAQKQFGVDITELAYYNDSKTTAGKLQDTDSRDVKGATIVDPSSNQNGNIYISVAGDDLSKQLITGTTGHEVVESVYGQRGPGLFSLDGDRKEAMANVFGDALTSRLNEATGGALTGTASYDWRQSVLNSDQVAYGTSKANQLESNVNVEYLVAGKFDKKTGKLSIKDLDTNKEVQGIFFSGTNKNNEIPSGKYAILQRGKKDGFRLEVYDSTFGDDKVNTTGQSLLRLHGPGASYGCVTACDASNWATVDSFIRNTSTGEEKVNTYTHLTLPGGYNLYEWKTGTEKLKYYGDLDVK